MRISDWSSDVCSSDLRPARPRRHAVRAEVRVSVMSLIPTASQTVGPYLHLGLTPITIADIARDATKGETIRSEEHTSELQSLMRISYAVFCLKKKTTHNLSPSIAPYLMPPLQYSNYTHSLNLYHIPLH